MPHVVGIFPEAWRGVTDSTLKVKRKITGYTLQVVIILNHSILIAHPNHASTNHIRRDPFSVMTLGFSNSFNDLLNQTGSSKLRVLGRQDTSKVDLTPS